MTTTITTLNLRISKSDVINANSAVSATSDLLDNIKDFTLSQPVTSSSLWPSNLEEEKHSRSALNKAD